MKDQKTILLIINDPELLHIVKLVYSDAYIFYKDSQLQNDQISVLITNYIQNIYLLMKLFDHIHRQKTIYQIDVSRIKRGIVVWKSRELSMKAQLYYGCANGVKKVYSIIINFGKPRLYITLTSALERL